MKFREHRGSLDDAMATLVEMDPDRESLMAHLSKIYGPKWLALMPDVSLIKVEHYYGPDPRIGWKDTWIVSLPGFGVLGFTDELPA